MDHAPSPIANRALADTKRRLSVNAAFLKDIKDDNRELKNLVDRINPLSEHPQIAANHWPEFVALLADLRDQLALHFSLEEAFGYFEEAIEVVPQLSIDAEQLRGQHATLFESIRDLADRACDVTSDRTEKVASLLSSFQRFRHAFEIHEEAEVKLILQSLDDDIGNGD
ncbi:hypothetical protein Poly51_15300 [Rubripirellula tenax]|uniref:Hemerythrin-like domain-containing protein n=1 Tax=Rubripirellula tenax TaxID=2528015 RepID=A0A5C6FDS7_9BACT|nr:hemerythrin domain-containing protein [Rubripirellula tenax]TWU58750.1 hypothetical protein Poly51_15300 [Rubripirellula tenax]